MFAFEKSGDLVSVWLSAEGVDRDGDGAPIWGTPTAVLTVADVNSFVIEWLRGPPGMSAEVPEAEGKPDD